MVAVDVVDIAGERIHFAKRSMLCDLETYADYHKKYGEITRSLNIICSEKLLGY